MRWKGQLTSLFKHTRLPGAAFKESNLGFGLGNEYLKLFTERNTVIERFFCPPDCDPGNVTSIKANKNAITSPNSALSSFFIPYLDFCVVPLRRLYSWGVPTEEALDAIVECCPGGIVEIGAGSGYWAYLLRKKGARVIAFDRRPLSSPKFNGHHAIPSALYDYLPEDLQEKALLCDPVSGVRPSVHLPPFVHVREGGPEVLTRFPKQALFLCWPPPELETSQGSGEDLVEREENLMAFDSLRTHLGDTLVYVGQHEDWEQCSTAGPRFHSLLSSEWALERKVPLPQWPLSQDALSIWRRKERREGMAKALAEEQQLEETAEVGGVPEEGVPSRVRSHLVEAYSGLWEEWVVARIVHRVLEQRTERELQELEKSVLESWNRRALLLRRTWVHSLLWLRGIR